MKKKIVALTIALIMLIGMQVFATTGGLSLTPTGNTSSTGTSTPTPTTSTAQTESTTSSTTKPETSLPKAGTSNVVLYGVSVLSVVAIVLYRKITK